jgi:hypothetical protein
MDAIEYKELRCYDWGPGIGVLPSVSAVLNVMYRNSTAWVDTAALDDGNKCHAEMSRAITVWLETGSPDGAELSERPAKLMQWIQGQGWEPIFTEYSNRSTRYGYSGTIDAGFRKGGRIFLPDFKFAESVGERYVAQIMMYLNMDWAALPARTREGYILQVPKGKDVIPRPIKPDPHLWAEIQAALTVIRKWLR